MRTVISRLESNSDYFNTLLHLYRDRRLVARCLIPLIPTFLAGINNVFRYFFARATTTWNSVTSLNTRAVFMQVDPHEVTMIFD
jgi:hypothetical protein